MYSPQIDWLWLSACAVNHLFASRETRNVLSDYSQILCSTDHRYSARFPFPRYSDCSTWSSSRPFPPSVRISRTEFWRVPRSVLASKIRPPPANRTILKIKYWTYVSLLCHLLADERYSYVGIPRSARLVSMLINATIFRGGNNGNIDNNDGYLVFLLG